MTGEYTVKNSCAEQHDYFHLRVKCAIQGSLLKDRREGDQIGQMSNIDGDGCRRIVSSFGNRVFKLP